MDNKNVKKQVFHPDVPEPLLKGKSPGDRWMYEQQSVQRQQNDWIIARLLENESRMDKSDEDREKLRQEVAKVSERIVPFEELKQKFRGGRIVVALLLGSVLLPLALALASAGFTRLFELVWK